MHGSCRVSAAAQNVSAVDNPRQSQALQGFLSAPSAHAANDTVTVTVTIRNSGIHSSKRTRLELVCELPEQLIHGGFQAAAFQLLQQHGPAPDWAPLQQLLDLLRSALQLLSCGSGTRQSAGHRQHQGCI